MSRWKSCRIPAQCIFRVESQWIFHPEIPVDFTPGILDFPPEISEEFSSENSNVISTRKFHQDFQVEITSEFTTIILQNFRVKNLGISSGKSTRISGWNIHWDFGVESQLGFYPENTLGFPTGILQDFHLDIQKDFRVESRWLFSIG